MSSLCLHWMARVHQLTLLTSKWVKQGTLFKGFPLGDARLTLVSPADGKIRLATLELSCLLLKQQVVTSTGCIIKDVHLACLEVRARSRCLCSTGRGRPWEESCWVLGFAAPVRSSA